eukprot:Skav213063  [mRNA]  locus=scaffold364:565272:566226:- [translate_table: standard]
MFSVLTGDEDLLQNLEIPVGELILESRIGTGFTAEVYKGIWTRRGDTVRGPGEGGEEATQLGQRSRAQLPSSPGGCHQTDHRRCPDALRATARLRSRDERPDPGGCCGATAR